MFALLGENLVDLVTRGRALKPVLHYYDKETKAVKKAEKEIKALEDTVPRIAGKVNGIVTPLIAGGKEFLRKFIRLGNRVLFHGPAGALTKEFQGWLESGSDHLGRLFEGEGL